MNAITIEQIIDKDFFLPETIEMAQKYIKEINVILFDYGIDNFNEGPCIFSIKNKDEFYQKSISKYILYLYSKAGWIITSTSNFNYYNFQIAHPKLEVFK